MNLQGAIRNWMFSTIRLEVETEDGELSHGTASICCLPMSAGEPHPELITFLVTCRHVVEGAVKIRFFMIRAEETDMTKPDLSLPREPIELDLSNGERGLNWVPHPNPAVDLATMPFGPILKAHANAGIRVCYRQYGPQHMASDRDLANLDVADDVVFIGYPKGKLDDATGLPIARRGSIATPSDLDFNGEPQFLIDASVFGGSSGSPVWAYINQRELDQDAGVMRTQHTALIGFVSSAWVHWREGDICEPSAAAGAFTELSEALDLGVVTSVKCLQECIDACHQHYRYLWDKP